MKIFDRIPKALFNKKQSIDAEKQPLESKIKKNIVNTLITGITSPKVTKVGRNIAIGAVREIINRNPVSNIASKAVLGAAKTVLPDNKHIKTVLDLSHEIIHGEPIIEKKVEKKKWYSFLSPQFFIGSVIAFILTFLFMKK